MSALELIREGLDVWTIALVGTKIPIPVILTILFGLGIALAAAVVRVRRQPPNKPEKIIVPDATTTPEALESAPFPIWSVIGDKVAFTNAKYHEAVGLEDSPEGLMAYAETDAAGRSMVNIGDKPRWFTTTEINVDEEVYTFALPADELVATENSLKRLMETLSTTFAHLPVGLAIFDADKSLAQFNPAISELLKLDPAWLAMRPSMSAFLEKIRENRHLPEQKNFLEWRRLLTEMNATTPNNNYSDEWSLPNGATLRVTGQAHTQGAITFLFEDISAQLTLERQRYAETALNQAVLDRVSDSIAVISAAGSISFANTSFDRLFGIESTNSLSTPHISTFAKMWPDTVSFWTKLQSFISQTDNRAPWATTLELLVEKSVDVFPMPDGSTLISLTDSGTLTESQQIKSIFQVADAMFNNSNEHKNMQDPLNLSGLTNFLTQREITFDQSDFQIVNPIQSDAINIRRILWYMVLAASNVCRDNGKLTLTSSASSLGMTITCKIDMDDILDVHNTRLPVNLLRQLIAKIGASMNVDFDGSKHPLTISCDLPVEKAGVVTPFLTSSA